MAVKIRLSRKGRTHTPCYRVVVADARSPRDGKFIEMVGTYNPLLEKGSPQRFAFVKERVEHWLSKGAQPTDRVRILLEQIGILKKKERPLNLQKAKPKQKAQERLANKEAKLQKIKEEAQAAQAAPAATESNAQEATQSPAPAAEAKPEAQEAVDQKPTDSDSSD